MAVQTLHFETSTKLPMNSAAPRTSRNAMTAHRALELGVAHPQYVIMSAYMPSAVSAAVVHRNSAVLPCYASPELAAGCTGSHMSWAPSTHVADIAQKRKGTTRTLCVQSRHTLKLMHRSQRAPMHGTAN